MKQVVKIKTGIKGYKNIDFVYVICKDEPEW